MIYFGRYSAFQSLKLCRKRFAMFSRLVAPLLLNFACLTPCDDNNDDNNDNNNNTKTIKWGVCILDITTKQSVYLIII